MAYKYKATDMCPKCESYKNKVIDSRTDLDRTNLRYRRRECLDCGYRWFTYEIQQSDLTALGSSCGDVDALKAALLEVTKLQENLKDMTAKVQTISNNLVSAIVKQKNNKVNDQNY